MSRLYASIDSDTRKTTATSRGHRFIDSHTRGWNTGVRVNAYADDKSESFDIDVTAGSNGGRHDIGIGTVEQMSEGRFRIRLSPDLGGGVFVFNSNGTPETLEERHGRVAAMLAGRGVAE